jgi:site-specific DNA-methyltransferase (cytosine-N4-specific)
MSSDSERFSASHPARFPAELPAFFIKMLTDAEDVVLDIFGGSNTTGFIAEALKRKWMTFEISREYLASSAFRFLEGQNSKTVKRVLEEWVTKLAHQGPKLFAAWLSRASAKPSVMLVIQS